MKNPINSIIPTTLTDSNIKRKTVEGGGEIIKCNVFIFDPFRIGCYHKEWNCYNLIWWFYAGGSEIRVERSSAQRIHGTAWGKHKIDLAAAAILRLLEQRVEICKKYQVSRPDFM